ncbi:60S ribosomal protein L28 [Trichoplax sp. H2]|uniref:Large ribosomal subunit protein eL28 n=1 Tax=Trichoplax adhaerens TaxID=10228 RepID=B3RP55_TRIAD|nr:expressed hypothetical protein [Trichoplax adhaerens]EDV28133.1 expressed hypothetical protein [Trichoplax adhaerens]RDD45394.1 60S ribosomal protein L28 [Trichoplax sp. H2]|eukprot:XP_002109967.1 expressed hypothetical protein [Trichoplax adhaerens]
MSSDLLWEVLRKHTAFTVKNQGTTFTKESNNLTNRHTYRCSGLVNKKTVGIAPNKDGKGVVLSLRKSKGFNKPARLQSSTTIDSNGRRSISSVRKILRSGSYRVDLEQDAIRRTSAILRSQSGKNLGKKRKSRRKQIKSA